MRRVISVIKQKIKCRLSLGGQREWVAFWPGLDGS